MGFTHSQTKRPFVAPLHCQLPAQDLISVRQLYLERRFKKCISLCEDLLTSEVSTVTTFEVLKLTIVQLHSTHKSFLHFHQAIAYESLGQSAHVYSRNKITFLERAKDKFTEALDLLPQPFTVNEAGCGSTTQPSPPVFSTPTEVQDRYRESPESIVTPSIQVSSHARTASDASSQYSTSDSSVSETYTVPDFDKYSPRPDVLAPSRALPRTVTFPDVQKVEIFADTDDQQPDDLLPTPEQIQQKTRLIACLSSTHVLAADLVPSPLFSRTKKIARIAFPPGIEPVSTERDDKLEITKQPPRPLPRTPFTHRDHLTIIPSRCTAVQTLITRFENKLPSPATPSSYTTASVPSSAFIPLAHQIANRTPTTARFAKIASIFQDSKTQARNLAAEVNASLSSHALSRYNTCLADFRTCLHTSVTRVDELIDSARDIQERRLQEKRDRYGAITQAPETRRLAQTRLRSFWLLESPALAAERSSATPKHRSALDGGNAERGRSLQRFDGRKTIYGPALHRKPTWIEWETKQEDDDDKKWTRRLLRDQRAEREREIDESEAGNAEVTKATTPFRDRLQSLRVEENGERKQQRLEKLRALKFEVRKEDFGWKGGRYYDDLARRVERTLGVNA